MTIRILLIDDEPLALASLESILRHQPDVAIVATCMNGTQAVKAITAFKPDLVFLDIQMPGIDGMEVVRRIKDKDPPLIVFVTAYNHFAVEAFELHALDYVLKPFVDARLLEALERARGRLATQQDQNFGSRLEAMLADLKSTRTSYPTRVIVKETGRTRIVMVDEILWIGSAANYVELHTADRTLLHRQSMEAMEELLDPARFVRIHRSTIVNLSEIREIIAVDRSRDRVILRNGTELKLSAGMRDRVRKALEGQ